MVGRALSVDVEGSGTLDISIVQIAAGTIVVECSESFGTIQSGGC